MRTDKTHAFELLNVIRSKQRVRVGFISSQLDEWDYSHPESGVVEVSLWGSGRASFAIVEGKGVGHPARTTLNPRELIEVKEIARTL